MLAQSSTGSDIPDVWCSIRLRNISGFRGRDGVPGPVAAALVPLLRRHPLDLVSDGVQHVDELADGDRPGRAEVELVAERVRRVRQPYDRRRERVDRLHVGPQVDVRGGPGGDERTDEPADHVVGSPGAAGGVAGDPAGPVDRDRDPRSRASRTHPRPPTCSGCRRSRRAAGRRAARSPRAAPRRVPPSGRPRPWTCGAPGRRPPRPAAAPRGSPDVGAAQRGVGEHQVDVRADVVDRGDLPGQAAELLLGQAQARARQVSGRPPAAATRPPARLPARSGSRPAARRRTPRRRRGRGRRPRRRLGPAVRRARTRRGNRWPR